MLHLHCSILYYQLRCFDAVLTVCVLVSCTIVFAARGKRSIFVEENAVALDHSDAAPKATCLPRAPQEPRKEEDEGVE